MAEKKTGTSIYTHMERGYLETTCEEDKFTHTLPSWFPKDINKEEVEALPEDIRFGLIAEGLKQSIIGIRAVARNEWKKEDSTIEKVNDRVEAFRPKAPAKRLTALDKVAKAVDELSPEELAAFIASAKEKLEG